MCLLTAILRHNHRCLNSLQNLIITVPLPYVRRGNWKIITSRKFYSNRRKKIKLSSSVALVLVLYVWETWSLILREEHRLRVLLNKALRIFGSLREDEENYIPRSLIIFVLNCFFWLCSSKYYKITFRKLDTTSSSGRKGGRFETSSARRPNR